MGNLEFSKENVYSHRQGQFETTAITNALRVIKEKHGTFLWTRKQENYPQAKFHLLEELMGDVILYTVDICYSYCLMNKAIYLICRQDVARQEVSVGPMTLGEFWKEEGEGSHQKDSI